MRASALAYFFAVAVIGFLAVRAAYRYQSRYPQPYLSAWTLYVGSWTALVLLSVVQFVLVDVFLPPAAYPPLAMAFGPLTVIAMAAALYFLTSFLAQVARYPLPRAYLALYTGAWGAVVVLILVASEAAPDHVSGWGAAAGVLMFLIKTATVYGWTIVALARTWSIDDPLERTGLRRVVGAFLGGYVVFDLALHDAAALLGIGTTNYVLALLQVAVNIPALVALDRFLARHSRERSLQPMRADLAERLAPLGLSVREIEVVELVLKGLSNKEIASRLFISTETLKKHAYNVYRKLGVQNRVQLNYFIHNQVPFTAGHGKD
ncbi:MAG: LuxR family transcriptional regulator [Acidobacteria bacterium]|nr:MAG: LuxR family transcriptional regulator [Acidobacteriota bacterium]